MSFDEDGLVREPRSRWPRRALVGFWVLLFAGAGAGLASSWDRIVDTLTRRPVPGSVRTSPRSAGEAARPAEARP